jgi:hypothetical protein
MNVKRLGEWTCTGLTKSPSVGFHLLLEVPVHV